MRTGLLALVLVASGCGHDAPAPVSGATPLAVPPAGDPSTRGDPSRFFAGADPPTIKVPLDGQTRNAIVASESPLSRVLDVTPGMALDVSYAQICPAAAGCAGSVRYSVHAAGAEDTQPETLLAHSLEGSSVWQRQRIDLDRFQGARIRVEFTVQGSSGARGVVPLWGEPLLIEPGGAAGPNVILVSVDTLRADRLGCYGYRRPTTPVLDAFAGDGVRFEQAISQSPWTIPAHVSLLTSLYPSAHQVNQSIADFVKFLGGRGSYRVLSDDALTLAEVLRGRGYRCLALTSSTTLSDKLGFAQGFDQYLERDNKLTPEIARELRRLLADAAAGPFFLFFHTYEVHTPYIRVARAHGLLDEAGRRRLDPLLQSGEDLLAFSRADLERHLQHLGLFDVEVTSALYDGGVREADAFLAELFGELERLGLRERTLVVVTSDHGEEFAEHTGRFYSAHGHTLYDEVLRVPLLLRMPGRIRPGTSVGQPVELIDVAPTILELIGVPIPGSMQGRSLVPAIDGHAIAERWAVSEALMWPEEPEWKSIRSAEHKYIAAFRIEDGERTGIAGELVWRKLFDLRSDGAERNDRIAVAAAAGESYHQLLLERFSAIAESARHDGSRLELDEPTLERLRALGYVD